MVDVVRPQVRTRSQRARRVVNFSQIPQLDHVRRDLNADRTYAVSQKGKREKRLPITPLIETAISNIEQCVRLEYRRTKKEMTVKWVVKKKRREEKGGKGGKAEMSGRSWLKRERKRDKSRREQ